MTRHGYKNTYVKSTYSRGAMRTRDLVYEAVVARNCEVCGKILERKISKNLRPEQWLKFLKRKTCGRNSDGTFSKCMIKNHIGDRNPKWRGGIPVLTCIDCGQERKHYLSIDRTHTQKYCWKCHLVRCSKRLKNLPQKTRKEHGARLQRYWADRGERPTPKNKVFDTCQQDNCGKKHLARGMCSAHYSKWRKHALQIS